MPERTVDDDTIAIIGGGPAGLMAADVLLKSGLKVQLFDAMPSLGRKFLMAGKSGLNLTHAEAFDDFVDRYGTHSTIFEPLLNKLGPQQLRDFAHELGIETFIGSSKRVFPTQMKAAPLLRAWLHRMRQQGLQTFTRHRWLDWGDNGECIFSTPDGLITQKSKATLFALGAASWPQLGSSGAWQTAFNKKQIEIVPFTASNCGLNYAWSDYLKTHHAGEAVKTVRIAMQTNNSGLICKDGDFVISETGLEGSLIYHFSSEVKRQIADQGVATLYIDLSPQRSEQQLRQALSREQGANSFAKHLQRCCNLKGIKLKLLRELANDAQNLAPHQLAKRLKALPIEVYSIRNIEEAISCAGGISFDEIDANFMLKKIPGVFCAGEMLDWDAPTGGYLFTGCFTTGYAAGHGIIQWLKNNPS